MYRWYLTTANADILSSTCIPFGSLVRHPDLGRVKGERWKEEGGRWEVTREGWKVQISNVDIILCTCIPYGSLVRHPDPVRVNGERWEVRGERRRRHQIRTLLCTCMPYDNLVSHSDFGRITGGRWNAKWQRWKVNGDKCMVEGADVKCRHAFLVRRPDLGKVKDAKCKVEGEGERWKVKGEGWKVERWKGGKVKGEKVKR